MRRRTSGLLAIALLGAAPALTSPAAGVGATATTVPSLGPAPVLHLPWREAGLSEREAAAFLLERLAYGPRPGEVELVAAMGLERWLARQLAADLAEPDLDSRLERFSALSLTLDQTFSTYPPPGLVLRQAREAGVIPADFDPQSLRASGSEPGRDGDGPEMGDGGDREDRARLRRDLVRFAVERGYHRQRDLVAQLRGQKLVRAVYAENQLAELMTGFWFNHFSVSIADNDARVAVLAYERDAIRPYALGRFHDLLGAVAKHPAMLLYLDNARSVAADGAPTTAGREVDRLRTGRRGVGGFGRRGFGDGAMRARRRAADLADPRARSRPTGLNENYARELLELHTLGVDGGYAQEDVVAVARAFTGWTVVPPRLLRAAAGDGGMGGPAALARLERFGGRLGFVRDGDFLFRADAHDAGAKTVLGAALPAGRGIEDGEAVLDLVAAHPATARHLARKLAVRLVSDDPPPALVERLATTFLASGGDVREVLRTLFASPEFWRPETRGAKIKSPLELAASALRAFGAEVTAAGSTVEWIAEMGEPLYACPAPTGFPDRAEAWLNAGTLLNRINFGSRLAAGGVAGVKLDPALAPPAAALLGSPDFQRR